MSDSLNDSPKILTLRLNAEVVKLLMTNAIQSRMTVSELVTVLAKEHLVQTEELSATLPRASVNFGAAVN